jgi:hypothetical protein
MTRVDLGMRSTALTLVLVATATWAGIFVTCLTIAAGSAAAGEAGQLTATCQILLSQQWQALSKGNEAAANKVLGRARQDGCLQPPVAARLCHIPAEQEAIQDLDGNTALVNIARSQQRLLGCRI